MADKREFYDGYGGEESDTPDFPHETNTPGDEALAAGEFPLRSVEDFEQQLEALEGYAAEDEGGAALDEALGALPDEPVLPDEVFAAQPRAETDAERAEIERVGAAIGALDQTERLRAPRAQSFRRRLRHQIGMLPLALLLIALGAYLLAREHDLADVPDLSTLALVELTVLGVGFTFIFHALLFGRRERGLLFLGLYIWITAGVIGVIAYGIDLQPDAREWWPALLWSLGLTLLVTFLLERGHDARLVLLAVLATVAGGAAYWVTSGTADAQMLDDVADYWPLLLAVLGVGLLPAAFRRGAR
ncbi:MAG: hypothetical protein KBH93_06130 [Anaerolineae bacterium]|nr:hypothetical protein [Anaerolineae bacterium]